MSGLAPLVLLDEIAAHFDPIRRDALFEVLGDLDGQIWLSGADPGNVCLARKPRPELKIVPGAAIEES